MKSGIYEILNGETGTWYRGQSIDIEKRLSQHRKSLQNGTHYNAHLQRSWDKWGEEVFSFHVLEECDESQLNEREEYWVGEWYNDPSISFNKKAGGDAAGFSEETKRKISQIKKGKKFSEEHKRKLSETKKGENNPFYGKKHTVEAIDKMSEAKKGENNPFYGKKHNAETRRKISEAQKAYWQKRRKEKELAKKSLQ